MDSNQRQILEELAVRRLKATAHSDEQWSFLFRTEGAMGLVYCPWSWMEDQEFDGDVDRLDLPWTSARKALLRDGDAEPTPLELQQWREANCRWAARGSDWCHPAWVVPLELGSKVEGYALFLCQDEDPDAEPCLAGVCDTLAEAKEALMKIGAVDGLS
jgi:hypothetical protein